MTVRPVRAAAWLAAALGPVVLARLALCADPQPSQTTSTALVRLSRSVAAQLSDASAEPPLAVYVASGSADLARSFATILISELAEKKLGPLAISAPSADAADSSAQSRGARSLVRLQVSLSNGLVQARGDLVSTWVNFWSGQSGARGGRPAAAIYASVDADAQALALAAATSAPVKARELQLEMAKLADLPSWTGALAAGDLNGDGQDEIVALTNDEILAFSSDGRLLARRDHRFLGDSTTPCREPFGAISIQSQRIAYFSAARRKGEVLTFDAARGEFRSLGPINEVPVAVQGQTQIWGSFAPGRSAFASELWSAAGERWSVPGPFWMLSFFSAANGARVLMAFADGTASLSSGLGELRPRISANAAAAMALVDVDGDGEPELVTTSPRYRPEPDELRVLSAPVPTPAPNPPTAAGQRAGGTADGGAPNQELWRTAIQGGWAIQLVGARAGAGQPEQIVVAVWLPDGSAQLRLFRRVAP